VAATIIVMETKTGRILALDNRPTYSPAFPGRVTDPTQRLNRAVCAVYEPGSIFKPFVMSAYIENHLGTPTDRIFCENGFFKYLGRRIHDVHPYGWLTYSEVIEKSSNIGMAKVGLQLGASRIFPTITAFGFGKSTGSGLPGELGGILTPFKSWSYYTVTSVPMGQEIAATPMQLVTAFNTIANGGVWVKPQVIDGISDADGKVVYQFTGPATTRRVISKESARTLIEMMMGVLTRGTAKSANFGDYVKAGKTGTAQKTDKAGGFSHSRFISSFLCMAPADDPKVSVLVLVDEPRSGGAYYGGTVSAPPAVRIVEKTLKYLGVEPPAGCGGKTLAQRSDL
jgi:cell division protein FtsI (penicillin-binding protein 3)